jgi:HNH endonuclease
MPVRRKPLEEYFWLRVPARSKTVCWLWEGRRDSNGYGVVQLHAGGKRMTASRASWIIHNGPIASNKIFVCHHCDNPPCVNPDHLFLGTQKDNLQDASKKGRMSVPGKGWERNKTHCSNGHPFSEENTYRWKNKRICRICHAALEAKRRERNQWRLMAEG